MNASNYRERLSAAVGKVDINRDLKGDSRLYLTWLLTQVFLGKQDDAICRSVFNELRKRPEKTDRPGADLIAWASLALSALLLNEPWEREAEFGIARIQPAIDMFGEDARFLEPAIGLMLMVNNLPEAKRLWDIRFNLPFGESTEDVGFESLFLTGDSTLNIDSQEVTFAFGWLLEKVYKIPISITLISHLGAFYRLSGYKNSNFRSMLAGAVDTLDEYVYDQDQAPRISWEKLKVSWKKDGNEFCVCSFIQNFEGAGHLMPFVHDVAEVASMLPSLVEEKVKKSKNFSRLFESRSIVKVKFVLPESIVVSGRNLTLFQSRIELAWKQVKTFYPEIKSEVSLDLEYT